MENIRFIGKKNGAMNRSESRNEGLMLHPMDTKSGTGWLGKITGLALMALLALASVPASGQSTSQQQEPKVQHFLLLTIDGFHALDLANYVDSHPDSALARLKHAGVTYNNAYASKPSDSFPGIVAMITGGSPYSTGIFYETSYDRSLSPAGSKCATVGTEIALDDSIDINGDAYDAGGGLDPAKLPLDPHKRCSPVFPTACCE